MKLEVGMFIRTEGRIFEIDEKNIDGWKIVLDMYEKKEVIASRNIIDLVQVGDYVNGCYVREITQFPRDNFKTIITETSTGFEDETEWFRSEDIKSIVTKEMFSSISYEVSK